MTKSFKEALKARRTFYQIENKSTLSDKEIRDLIRFAVEFVPSAFNSQTTRVALLTGKAHEKLWNIVDRKSTRLNSSHVSESRMPSSA